MLWTNKSNYWPHWRLSAHPNSFETKLVLLHWGQCLCHAVMQSNINANHTLDESFHWNTQQLGVYCPRKPFLSGTRVDIQEEMCTMRHKIRLFSSSPRSHDLWPVRGDKWWICAARPKQREFSHLNRQNQQLTPVTINFKDANCFSWQLHVCVCLWGHAYARPHTHTSAYV